jgi:predicted acetyltransferase
MTKRAQGSSDHLEVIPATPEHEPVLANLIELYAHDFSEFHAIELGADGRFGYEELPLYWREAGRHPFLIKVAGKLAGFVLVKRESTVSDDATVWDMAEFFVARRYRRCGIGTKTAHQVWNQFPGRWEVRVMHMNHSANQFWQRAISAFVGKSVHSVSVEKGQKSWNLFSFQSPEKVADAKRL